MLNLSQWRTSDMLAQKTWFKSSQFKEATPRHDCVICLLPYQMARENSLGRKCLMLLQFVPTGSFKPSNLKFRLQGSSFGSRMLLFCVQRRASGIMLSLSHMICYEYALCHIERFFNWFRGLVMWRVSSKWWHLQFKQ